MAFRLQIGPAAIELVCGDITDQRVDGIVNAANAQLAGGGGVDGAIHRAGGPEIMAACREIGGCPTGGAVATPAGKLQARMVLHAVGPIYRDGQSGEPELLASAYRSVCELAVEHDLASLAFPSLSTGAYRYPMEDAARIALTTIRDYVNTHARPGLVRFVLFDPPALATFERVAAELR